MTLDRAQRFVDCSSARTPTDLAAYAKAGHKWLAIKATEGTGYIYYAGNVIHKQALDLGLKVIRYHWIDSVAPARQQAELFVRVLEALGIDTHKGMADFEWPWQGPAYGNEIPSHRAEQLRLFNHRVHELLPNLSRCNYTNVNYCTTQAMRDAVGALPVIQADYSTTRAPVPTGWDVCAWQWTSAASVPGFAGEGVDYNRILDREFFGTGKGKDSGPVSETFTREEAINLNIQAMRALEDGKTHGAFGPGNPAWAGTGKKLRERISELEAKVRRLDERERKS